MTQCQTMVWTSIWSLQDTASSAGNWTLGTTNLKLQSHLGDVCVGEGCIQERAVAQAHLQLPTPLWQSIHHLNTPPIALGTPPDRP